MKKITLTLLLFAVTCFTFGQTTITKSYLGPTVTVDGCGTYCVTLPGVTFTTADFPGCGPITDVNVSIDWLKTDGSCAAPGTGSSFHNETNFRIDGPTAMEILAVPGTWTGSLSTPPVTTVFDQAAAGPPIVADPVSGTFQPNGGNLDNFNGLSPLGTWNLLAGDTAGLDPLCVIAYSVTITVLDDTTPPTIGCPADIVVNNDPGVCGAAVVYGIGFSDNCPGATLMQTAGQASGTVFPIGTTTNTFVVTDTSGNTATCSFDVTVNDAEGPVIVCPADIVMDNDPGVCGATITYTAPVGTDNCPGESTVQTAGQASGTVFPVGTTTNTFVVTDASGNTATCSFDVTVNDVEDPTITCPADVTVSNDAGLCSAVVIYTVTTSDNCPGETLVQTAGQASGTAFPVGTTTNTFVVTDASGNTATCSFDVTVNDTEPPNAVCLGSGPTTYLSSDFEGGPGGWTNGNDATTTCGIGTSGPGWSLATQTGGSTPVVLGSTWYGTPNAGDSGAERSWILSPVFVAAASTMEINFDSYTSNEGGYPTNYDVEHIQVSINAGPFTDLHGNDPQLHNNNDQTFRNITYSAAVTVGDSVQFRFLYDTCDGCCGPSNIIGWFVDNVVISSPAAPVQVILDATGNASITVADINGGSSDNCGIASTSIDITDFTCADIGTNIVTLTVTDIYGNVSTCTSEVLVIDDQPPVAVCQDITIQLDANGMVSIVPADIDGGSTDNCAITLSADITDFTCADVGVNVVTLTVTDEGGNITTCTSNVTVEDNVPPVAICNSFDVFLDAAGMVSITVGDVDGGSTDACGIASTTIDIMDFTCADIGPNNVTLTVTDNNGNVSTCVGVVTVIDDMPPVISCPADVNAFTDPGQCSAVVTFPDAIALDNCMVTVAQTGGLPSGDPFPVGVNFVEFTATDAGGNTAVCIMTITVTDNEDPVAICQDITVELDANGEYVLDPLEIDNGSSDNCSIVSYEFQVLPVQACGPSGLLIPETGTSGPMLPSPANVTDVGDIGVDYTIASVDLDLNHTFDGDLDITLTSPMGTVLVLADQLGGAGDNYTNTVFADGNPNITTGAAPFTGMFEPQGGTLNGTFAGESITGDWTLNIFDNFGGDSGILNNYCINFIPVGGLSSLTLDCDDVGVNTITLVVTDASGNTATCTSMVTVEDNIAPVIVCIGEQVTGPNTESDSPGTVIVDNTTVSTTITVPDSFTITDLNVDMNITHTWVGDLQITLESPASTQVLIFDGSADGCSGDNIMDLYDDESANPLSCVPASGDAFPLADYIPSNALSAFDGEDSAGVWTLFVEDTAGGDAGTIDSWSIIYDFDPIVTPPLEVDLDANGMATILASDLLLSVDEACGWTATVAGVGAPVSLETTFAGGNGNFGNMFDMNALNDVTVESFDIHGDTGATFDVEVYAKAGTYVGFETDPGAWTLIGTAPGVVSNGDGVATPLDLMLGYDMGAGETHAFYVTPTDFSTGGFNYTNGTGVGNVFASDANIEFLEGSGSGYPFNGTLFSPRVWNGNIIYTAGGGMSTTIDFTCEDLGENIIEVTVTDDSGNVATCTATVNVNDVTPPVLICMDVTIELDENGMATIDPNDLLGVMPSSYEVITISSDNQSGAVGNTDLTVPVTVADNITFDWMYNTSDGPAFDSFGYLLNGVFTEVIDPGGANTQMGTTGPIAVAPGDVFGFRSSSVDGLFGPSTTVVSNFIPGFTGQFEPANWTLTLDNSDGDAFFVEIPGGPLSFDACGIEILAADVTEVDCDDIGTPIVVTVFASDSSLNIAVCQSTVTVVDLLPPVVTCPEDQTVDPGVGNLFWEVEDYFALGEATATDNCTDPVTLLSQDPPPGTLLIDGVYTITMTAEDEYGNVGTCTFELTVESILGVDDNTIDISTIVMYPNPAIDKVYISNPQSIDLERAAIYDVTGRLIHTYDLRDTGTEATLDISILSTATYLVVIQGQGSYITKQLIKE